MGIFKLKADFPPRGDQPEAIAKLIEGVRRGDRRQTLLGVTGSGKTFTMANVIAGFDLPALVISHNKTLAAQLYSEFRDFFPDAAVGYFVSYYDYYQPEAYIPQKDIYIEKDASINEDLDRLRLYATTSLMTRRDVIIVASVSCIYGLGSPDLFSKMMVPVKKGMLLDRREFLLKLNEIQYRRADADLVRGTYRVRGDSVEIFPSYNETVLRVSLEYDEVAAVEETDPLTGEVRAEHEEVAVYPAKHYVIPHSHVENALDSIRAEIQERLKELRSQGKLLEAQRLEVRTKYDIELIEEIGYCPGIENYSRHLDGRPPGSRPSNLIDYFPKDFLLFIDESHVTIPQLRAMYNGDRSRKECLVEHGFRLPSALDNRPMTFEEFETAMPRTIFVSATPGPYEIACSSQVVEQIIRPTGLVDPPVEVRPTKGQIKVLVEECRKRAARGERALITTLTKRLAEHLAEHMAGEGLKAMYLHSDLDAIERVEILRDLRAGNFDVLVGVNLLREGLDLPEVSLVAVLDADKEGFLRSQTSLIQTIGRAARNVNGNIILFADEITPAMHDTIRECERRREKQLEYNRRHNITPQTIRKAIKVGIEEVLRQREAEEKATGLSRETIDRAEELAELEAEMHRLAGELRFEEAAMLRDRILELRGKLPSAPAVRLLQGVARKKRRGGRKGKSRDAQIPSAHSSAGGDGKSLDGRRDAAV